jgi:hypothetical protein
MHSRFRENHSPAAEQRSANGGDDYSLVTTTTPRTEERVELPTHPRDARRLRHLRCGPVLDANLHKDGVEFTKMVEKSKRFSSEHFEMVSHGGHGG